MNEINSEFKVIQPDKLQKGSYNSLSQIRPSNSNNQRNQQNNNLENNNNKDDKNETFQFIKNKQRIIRNNNRR